MCGIAGAVIISGSPLRADDLVVMRDQMIHRGPDDAGIWLSNDRKIGLAHRRLTIIDLSDRAAQPMSDVHHGVVVSFNGEIYNYKTLWKELEAAGYQFQTDHSDTEVLVHGYHHWGFRGLLERLNGMFAIALYDVNLNKLFLARDRIGIKPLYVAKCAGTILFASEIKAILAYPGMPRELSRQAVYDYLTFLVTPAPGTMFSSVQKLPPGHVMMLDISGAVRVERYWSPLTQKSSSERRLNLASSDPVAMVRDTLDEAVQARLVSDVPIGAFLSGGIDSTAILALMAKHGATSLTTYTAAFTDAPEADEREHARASAERYGAEHYEILITERGALERLTTLPIVQDEPLADWVCIPLMFLSQAAHDNGTKVVLVGEGSDELFCGYGHYLSYLKRRDLYRALSGSTFMRLTSCGLSHLLRFIGGGRPGADTLADVLSRASQQESFFWGGAIAYWEAHKNRLFTKSFNIEDDVTETLIPCDSQTWRADSGRFIHMYGEEFRNLSDGDDPLRLISYIELCHRLPELLLMRIDKMTMASSLEARVPFLDHKLVENVLQLSMQQKIPGLEPKALLKSALTGLVPHHILHQRKRGFSAPVSKWLRGQFGETAREIVLESSVIKEAGLARDYIDKLFAAHSHGGHDYAHFLWPLINLSLWYDAWFSERFG